MNRSTLLLLALLVVLGAIVYLVLPRDEERISSETRAPAAFAADSASVVRLSIERPGKRLVIENVGGRWMITSHGNLPADPARVTELVGGLSRFKTGSLVSTNPAKQGLFQVDSAGSLVTLTERSGAVRSIVIGKMGPSFTEVYFRLPGGSDVYLGSGITTWSLERDVREWRDMTIFSSPAEAITGLTLTAGGKSREYRKDSTGWKSGGQPVPTGTINPVLTALSGLRADDFIDSAVQLSGTPSRVEVSGAVSATIEFYRLGSDTARYAVQTSVSPQKYIVGKYAASQLFTPVGEPMPSGVASVRKAPAREPEEKSEESVTPAQAPPPSRAAARPPVKTETAPAETREAVKEAARPPADQPAGATTINPFKQKTQAERQQQGGTTAPPAAGTPAQTRTQTPAQQPAQTGTIRTPAVKPPAAAPDKAQAPAPGLGNVEDDGELNVHVVTKGETMTSIARQYGVTVEQILKWNLLKSISVKPGQELYIFVRK